MIPRSSIAAAVALVACTCAAAQVTAAGKPHLTLAGGRVGIGRSGTLVGSNMAPGKFYTFLLAVPNIAHYKARGILPAVAGASGSGTFRVTARFPVVTHCGRATVYAQQAGQQVLVPASVWLTGCRASGSASAPPPPPAKSKKKHRS